MIKKTLLFFSVFLLFLNIFSYEKFEFNKKILYFQNSDELYDYVSIIIDIGYTKKDLINNVLFTLENTIGKNYPIYSYHVYPSYVKFDFYLQREGSEEFLIAFTDFLNSKLLNSQKEYSVDFNTKSLVNRNMGIEYNSNSKIIKDNVNKCVFGIISCSRKKNIINIIKNMNINNGIAINGGNKLLYGKFANSNELYITDIGNIKNYNLPKFLLLKYLLNIKDIYSNVYTMNNTLFFISSKNSKIKFSEREFERSIKLLHTDLKGAQRSILYLFNNFHFFVFHNKTQYLIGIDKKISDINIEEMYNFINNTENSFVYEIKKSKKDYNNYKKEKLKNGIELIYSPSQSINTEISILIKNYINIESYYSKPFAGELLINHIKKKAIKWNVLNTSLISDYEIFYANINNDFFEQEYAFFVNTVKNISFDNIRNEFTMDSLIKNMNNYKSIKQVFDNTYYKNRFLKDKGALHLTDGEYSVLLKKFFSNDNIIIVVKSQMGFDSIKNIINKYLFFKTNLNMEENFSLNKEYMNNSFILSNNYKNKKLLKNIIYTIFNFPDNNILNKNFYYTETLYSLNKSSYNKNVFPFNAMYMNAETNLMAMSYYINGDPMYFLNIIK